MRNFNMKNIDDNDVSLKLMLKSWEFWIVTAVMCMFWNVTLAQDGFWFWVFLINSFVLVWFLIEMEWNSIKYRWMKENEKTTNE